MSKKKKVKKIRGKKVRRKKNIFSKKTVITVGYSDLEQFIEEKTGQKLHIPDLLEATNGSEHEVSVNKDDLEFDFDCHKREKVEDFLFNSDDGNEPEYMTMNDVMCALCKRGIIEAGDYLIKVWW